MNSREIADLILNKGQEYGIEEMEIYIVRNSSMMFHIYEGNLEDYCIAEESCLSLRGMNKGKMGYAYTEKLQADAIDELIGNLVQYAENNDSKDAETFFSLNQQFESSESKWCALGKYTEEEKISFLKSVEKAAHELDKRIAIVETCSYEEYRKTIMIKSTHGPNLEAIHSLGVIGLSVVAKEKENVQTGYERMVVNDLSEECRSKIVNHAVKDAVGLLGASVMDSGKYEVVLRNNAAADLFSFMSPIFLGSMVQKNLSLLKGKIGQKVGTDLLKIVDDPMLECGKIYRTFDDEGVHTNRKYIIEDGVLKTFLHNNKTAAKEGIESTGNGFRVSHKSSIDVMTTNMYIIEGNTSLEEMLYTMVEGIIITDVQGLHAGINTISGDFSLSSSGYLIKNGKIEKPVNQITISGNFYAMLNNITMIGNDTKFCAPEMNYFGSPSLKVGQLTVAGR